MNEAAIEPRIARGSGKTVTQTSILAEVARLRNALATIAETSTDDVAARTAREALTGDAEKKETK